MLIVLRSMCYLFDANDKSSGRRIIKEENAIATSQLLGVYIVATGNDTLREFVVLLFEMSCAGCFVDGRWGRRARGGNNRKARCSQSPDEMETGQWKAA